MLWAIKGWKTDVYIPKETREFISSETNPGKNCFSLHYWILYTNEYSDSFPHL